jgi:casein kinase II subunit alpha
MGTENLVAYLKKYKLSLPTKIANKMKNWPERDLEDFINKGNQHLVSEDGLDLLRRMLVYDKNERITP